MAELSTIAIKRLRNEGNNIRKLNREILDQEGFEINFDETKPNKWAIRLFNFDKNSKIYQDLQSLAKTNHIDSIQLEMEFPPSFPMSAPFVRILYPRIQFLTGGVSFGGTICADVLSKKGWTPVMEVRQLIREIKQHLVTHGARIDTTTSNLNYSEQEAKAAHYRSMLINSTEIPSKGNYRKRLRVMSAARLEDSIDLERGNKVLLPPSVLQFLSSFEITFPLIFELNLPNFQRLYCGVLEFMAAEDTIVLPNWMMRMYYIEEDCEIELRSVSLPKCTFVKFQPHSLELLKSNSFDTDRIVALLEFALPHYSTLTLGDTIELVHNGQTHLLNVLEIQPASAVSLVAEPYLDIKIEFAQALDYSEEDVKSGMRAFEAPSSVPTDKKPTVDTSGQTLGNTNNNSTANTVGDASTQICPNCKKAISRALFVMHENTCRRLNAYCDKCHQVVPKDKLTEHNNEFHALVSCECGEQIESGQLARHKKRIVSYARGHVQLLQLRVQTAVHERARRAVRREN
eukprot:TRINITY_DN8162_c0_g1_i1.p1 TRINITY_DN8162_c0_g1~~TRINITY_DN8162_c0_g1_i1.p1  ORF type:complete len:515 (+),score=117.06 TRINITY_DN8162_c0_g1_i1:3-1547(+)